VGAQAVEAASQVAVEAHDTEAWWKAGSSQLVIDALIALLTAVCSAAIIDVVKGEKRTRLFAATDASWGVATICA